MSISLAPELKDFSDQEELRREIQKGMDSLDQGKGLDGPTVTAELKAKYEYSEALRAEIQLGLASLNRGERDLWEIESIKAEGRKRLAAERGAA